MKYWSFFLLFIVLMSCGSDDDQGTNVPIDQYPHVTSTFGDRINLDQLANYANQEVPDYITKNNAQANPITDAGATLGRVLFYDTELSADHSLSCASCHDQALAFSDVDIQSQGINGLTKRHSMRLVNNRFAEEFKFFWDERAPNLMAQTTMPIQDHIEMGFSGEDGDMNFQDLITRLEALGYYQELFTFVYGSPEITEEKIQKALAQFVSSIQSFDTPYDEGRAVTNNDAAPFPNFSQLENQGKRLFLLPPQFNGQGQRTGGGLGCAGCHRPPEFDIDPNSQNNGAVGNIAGGFDFTNTRAPSLREVLNAQGVPHTGFMHNANFNNIQQVLEHYNFIFLIEGNNNLDPRLRPGGNGQRLEMTLQEFDAVIAFFQTLTGENVYTDPKWSNPFE